MTKLGELYEKEKIEYANEIARKACLEAKYLTAKKMLDRELDLLDIMAVTGLSEAEILSLRDKQIV